MKKLISAVIILAASTVQAATIFVDAANCPGPGDGSELDPYCTIQMAIDNAVNGCEVVVANGTYTGSGNRDLDFGGKLITVRSASDDPTLCIIDCQSLGRGFIFENGETSLAVVQGFTITNGKATQGGGMYNSNSSPTVTNCAFTSNSADPGAGGGMFNSNSSPTVTHCIFSGNTCVDDGGGMHNREGSNPTVSNCDFLNNSANDQGGGMRSQSQSSATVIDCSFIGNKAGDDGDAENDGGHGGGMSCSGTVAGLGPIVINCDFTGNSAGFANGPEMAWGGGLHSTHSNPFVINCTFSDNSARLGGATFCNANGHPVMVNCTFIGNSARSHGGGAYLAAVSRTFRNCTFNGNSAIGNGGGIYNAVSSNAQVTNCILWNDTPDEIFHAGTPSDPFVKYSNVEGGHTGIGNINVDPMFVDGDLRLSAASPCIDAGNNWGVFRDTADVDNDGDVRELTPLDLDGNPRFADDPADDSGCGVPVVVDMGAYEFVGVPAPNPIYLGDLDADGVVGIIDFLALLANWGKCEPGCCLSDLNISGEAGDNPEVGILDFLLLLGNWG